MRDEIQEAPEFPVESIEKVRQWKLMTSSSSGIPVLWVRCVPAGTPIDEERDAVWWAVAQLGDSLRLQGCIGEGLVSLDNFGRIEIT